MFKEILLFSCRTVLIWAMSQSICASFKVQSAYYGNGQNSVFKQAMEGGEPLSDSENEVMARLLPETDSKRFYGKVRLNYGEPSIHSMINKNNAAVLEQLKIARNQTGLEAAIGYTWTKWRMEAEVMLNRNYNYNNPTLYKDVLVNQNLISVIKSSSLLANLYYDFTGVNFFRPYLMAGAGVAYNSTKSTVIDTFGEGSNASRRRIGLAYNVGLGLRYRAFKTVDLDIGYRYGFFGPVEWRTSQTQILGNARYHGFAIGCIYFF